ncbi:hypothetical protein CRM22_000595 [Opisthorchis felineus]|uniref:Flavodoxin-like domain-containing protein n=1 Tax=Opisthorchis felineus TaxID=147828 RepID=A0A4S2MEC3_OPIFE|nr:hypothetical protein CRM22_000595 [Opisthorchis felineus]
MVNLSLVDLVCCFLAVLLFFYVRFKRGALVISARRSPEATRLRTSNIKTFMEGVIQHNTRLFLFYGSQTGTAEHLAIGLHSFFFYQGLCPLLLNIAACDMAELNKLARAPNLLAIFILATHGHGEPTDDAREFVEHLRQRTTKLTELHFAVFGLGNSAYEQFNACAILVDRLLRRLGGIRLIEVGLGDELNNMEGTFLTWQASLLEAITQNCLVPDGKLQTFTNPMRRVYKPAPLQSKYTKLFTGEPYSLGSYERQTKLVDCLQVQFIPYSFSTDTIISGGVAVLIAVLVQTVCLLFTARLDNHFYQKNIVAIQFFRYASKCITSYAVVLSDISYLNLFRGQTEALTSGSLQLERFH